MAELKAQEERKVASLILRYGILAVLALYGFELFYTIFRPITVYPVHWILSLFYDTTFISLEVLKFSETLSIEFVPACIAGAAYYLLLALNLATPKIKLGKRINMILIAFIAFLITNVLRISILASMAFSGSSFFDAAHLVFWYLLSTVFVVAIWFAEVKYFEIEKIPFYSDIKFLHKNSFGK